MSASQFKYHNDFKLTDQHTVAEAAQLLIANKLALLPVTNAAGKYLGVFSLNGLLALILPRAALMEGGLTDLGFLSDRLEILTERMHEHSARPLGELLEKNVPVIHPETPLLEIVLYLYRGENDIPVVDAKSGKLLGLLLGTELVSLLGAGT
jgi:CBS domain-containing protein